MCFIAVCIKLKEDKDLIYPIVKTLLKEQNSHSDGTGAFCFNKIGDKFYNEHKIKEDGGHIRDNLNSYDVVNYHFRTSTGGNKNESNTHFWKRGEWVFAHNGTVSEMKDSNKADSLVFFEKLLQYRYLKASGNVEYDKIKQFNADSYLFGRFVIINSRTKQMYFFGDFKAYALNRNYIILTSASANFESTLNLLGIDFKREDSIEVLESSVDGINTYTFENGFAHVDDSFKASIKYNNNINNNSNKNSYWRVNKKNNKWEKVNETEKKVVKTETEAQLSLEIEMENEYQVELKKLDNKYFEAVTKFEASKKTNEDLKELERAECDYDIGLEDLDNSYFGLANRKTDIALAG